MIVYILEFNHFMYPHRMWPGRISQVDLMCSIRENWDRPWAFLIKLHETRGWNRFFCCCNGFYYLKQMTTGRVHRITSELQRGSFLICCSEERINTITLYFCPNLATLSSYLSRIQFELVLELLISSCCIFRCTSTF